nr:YncE family protein [Mycobacterium tuberculosis]
MAVSPVTGLVFVTNFDSNTVSVIDPNTNTVTGSIPVGTGAYGVAVNPGGNIYVTNQGSNTVSVIDPATNTVTGSPIPVGLDPTGVAVNPVTGVVYVTNSLVSATVRAGLKPSWQHLRGRRSGQRNTAAADRAGPVGGDQHAD